MKVLATNYESKKGTPTIDSIVLDETNNRISFIVSDEKVANPRVAALIRRAAVIWISHNQKATRGVKHFRFDTPTVENAF